MRLAAFSLSRSSVKFKGGAHFPPPWSSLGLFPSSTYYLHSLFLSSCSNFLILKMFAFKPEQVSDEIEQRNRINRAQERYNCSWHHYRFLLTLPSSFFHSYYTSILFTPLNPNKFSLRSNISHFSIITVFIIVITFSRRRII